MLLTSLLVVTSNSERSKEFFIKRRMLSSSSIANIRYTFYGLLIPLLIYTFALRIIMVSIGLILICFSLVLITRSIVVPMGMSLSFLLGLGQMLLQFSDAFLYFPIISTMNSFFMIENQSYIPYTIGIAIQFLWGILLLSFSFLLFRKRIVR